MLSFLQANGLWNKLFSPWTPRFFFCILLISLQNGIIAKMICVSLFRTCLTGEPSIVQSNPMKDHPSLLVISLAFYIKIVK